MIHRPTMLVALVIVCALVFACSSETESKPETRDTSTPRLVVLSPAIAATLQQLHAADLIVGRHEWDLVLPKSLPICGSQAELDYEAILRTNPTHVVIEWGQRNLPEALLTHADRAGFEIMSMGSLLTLEDIDRTTSRLIDEVLKPAGYEPAEHPRVGGPEAEPTRYTGRVLLLGQIDPPAALGPGSFSHQILESLNATPALSTGGPWQQLDHEDLLRIDPDAIVLVAPGSLDQAAKTDKADQDHDAAMRAILVPGLRATADDRFAVSRNRHALLPSTRLVEWRAELRAILDGFER